MRIIAKFEKKESVRFVSHLDVQRLFQRAFRRAGVPVAYSNGFNPHPQLAFATALTVGATSSAEWLDVKLERDMPAQAFMCAVNAAMPVGFHVTKAVEAEDKYPALTALMAAAKYDVSLQFPEPVSSSALQTALVKLLSTEIVVLKKTKAGMKNVDIRPQVYDMRLCGEVGLSITGCLNAEGSLNIDLLLGAYKAILGTEFTYSLHRAEIYSTDEAVMPKYEGIHEL